jgi:hypothetical protein
VVDGGDEICVRDRRALTVRDRDQRHFVEAEIERLQVRQILPAVQRRQRAARKPPKQRKLELVDVKVQDVEIVSTFAHSVQHQHVIRNRIAHVPVEPQRRPRATDKASGRHGIAACEQGHVVTQPDEFLRKIRDNPLRAAIEPRRQTRKKLIWIK